MADEDIPYSDAPDASPRVMPDQQAASGQPYGGSPSPASLLSAIGSMGGGAVPPPAMMAMGGGGGLGGLPPEAILGLLQQAPSAGMGYAQALAGGVSAMRNQPNPVSAIMDQQQRQRMGIMQMLEKMQAQYNLDQYRKDQMRVRKDAFTLAQQRLADAEKMRTETKLKDQITLARETLNNPNTNAEGMAWASRDLKKATETLYGTTVPDSIVTRTLTKDDKDELIKDVVRVAGRDPTTGQVLPLTPEGLAQVAQWHPRVSPDQIGPIVPMLNKPGALEDWGLKSDAQIKDEQVARDLRKQQLIEAQLPLEQRRDPKWFAALEAAATKAFPGTDFVDLTKAQRARVYELARLQDQAEKLSLHQQTAAIDAAKQLQVFGAQRGILQAEKAGETIGDKADVYVNKAGDVAPPELTKPEARQQGFFQIKPAELVGLNKSAQALMQLHNLKDTVDAADRAGLFVQGEGVLSNLWQRGNIARRKLGESDARTILTNLEAQKAELINLLRQVGDNARAAVLQIPAIQTLSPASGAAGIRSVLSNIETAIRAGGVHSRTPDLFTQVPQIFAPSLPGTGPRRDEDGWAPGVPAR